MANGDKLPIHLMVGRQDLALTVNRSDEEAFRKAARQINERLAKYEQTYPGQAYEKYLAFTLLDFAVFNLRLEDNKDIDPVMESIRRLTSEIHDQMKTL